MKIRTFTSAFVAAGLLLAVPALAQKQKTVQKCTLAVATCHQQKPMETKCLPKARTNCAKAIAKLTQPAKGLEAKLAAALVKSCGPPKITAAELTGAMGLGFDGRADQCVALGAGVPADVDDVAACVLRLHECRAEQLLELETPRLRELLTTGGVSLP